MIKNNQKNRHKTQKKEKIAILAINLGAPDNLKAVRPFLFNLFCDPLIIRLAWPLRYPLAWLISTLRNRTAQEIYKLIGGKSPLLENSQKQMQAIEAAIKQKTTGKSYIIKSFIAMRYWHPMSLETAKKLQKWAPDRIIFLPLYPQFSTTTTKSSLVEWQKAIKKIGLQVETSVICCYPTSKGFITSSAKAIVKALHQCKKAKIKPRILLSAHGIPKSIAESGDPYDWQVIEGGKAIMQQLDILQGKAKNYLDYRICYQSRVGRMEWLQPYTEEEIKQAGKAKIPLIIVPLAFISEHSETLVELDIEYREIAEEAGVPEYLRVPTVSISKDFIDDLADIILRRIKTRVAIAPDGEKRLCGAKYKECPCSILS